MTNLVPGYSYKVMTRAELQPFFERYHEVVFAETHHLAAHYAHSDTEQAAISSLANNLARRFTLGFGLFHGDTFVGWHFGQQVLAGKFEMTRYWHLKRAPEAWSIFGAHSRGARDGEPYASVKVSISCG